MHRRMRLSTSKPNLISQQPTPPSWPKSTDTLCAVREHSAHCGKHGTTAEGHVCSSALPTQTVSPYFLRTAREREKKRKREEGERRKTKEGAPQKQDNAYSYIVSFTLFQMIYLPAVAHTQNRERMPACSPRRAPESGVQSLRPGKTAGRGFRRRDFCGGGTAARRSGLFDSESRLRTPP